MEGLINEYALYWDRDYFDCRDSAGRLAIAEKMMLPPAPMVKMGQFWGDGWSVVVAGDEGHMLREVDRLRRNELTRVAATDRLAPPRPGSDEHKRWSFIHRMPPGPDREEKRSVTFPGIARAAATQWGRA